MNTPWANRIGSVGRPLPGVEVRIATRPGSADPGEILTRGPHVMRGYVGQDALTREVIDGEGWLHTGDLGHLDADGFLYVTGRAKDVIGLGGGRKVPPDEVQEHLGRSALFAEVCVLAVPTRAGMARGSDEVCAVVVPRPELAARAATDTSLETA